MNNKILILSDNTDYKTYDFESSTWEDFLISEQSPTEQEFIDNGMEASDVETIPESAWRELDGQAVKILQYTDNPSTTEITIETEVEPYDIYDEFGEKMEVLYYTDDPEKTEAELEITANYSPLDEIEGDFEVVTWTDEAEANDGDRIVVMNAVPQPQFVHLMNPATIDTDIQDFIANTSDQSSKMFLVSSDKITWKAWKNDEFLAVSVSNQDEIPKVAMSSTELSSITKENWSKWGSKNLYLGVYLTEGDIVENISYTALTPKESTIISDARLYILNTISTIDMTFAGSTLTGQIDDEDEGRVQYRVILNGQNYYPADGSFTPLKPSPQNINITLSNKDYRIDENNTLKVEFKDYWGTVDYWSTNFIGTYNGLLFADETGNYYSTEIGDILKYLDFGTIIAGQTTTEQEIILKNTYGFPVKNVTLYTKDEFPAGMRVQFGSNLASFEAVDRLTFDGIMYDGDQRSFYVRLSTVLGLTPPTENSEFDIVVVADRLT